MPTVLVEKGSPLSFFRLTQYRAAVTPLPVMVIYSDQETPLAAAVKAAGSQSAFGRLIGKRQSTVNDWLRLKKPLPSKHLATVEQALGIPRHVLRPDLYPSEPCTCPARQNYVQTGNGMPVDCRIGRSQIGTPQIETAEAIAA